MWGDFLSRMYWVRGDGSSSYLSNGSLSITIGSQSTQEKRTTGWAVRGGWKKERVKVCVQCWRTARILTLNGMCHRHLQNLVMALHWAKKKTEQLQRHFNYKTWANQKTAEFFHFFIQMQKSSFVIHRQQCTQCSIIRKQRAERWK